jgi:hypothetical protein
MVVTLLIFHQFLEIWKKGSRAEYVVDADY